MRLNICCFKLINFGVFCYAAIDNNIPSMEDVQTFLTGFFFFLSYKSNNISTVKKNSNNEEYKVKSTSPVLSLVAYALRPRCSYS